ncbi:hypothetical protein MP228_007955 [Amoeboaphelidium protococcarum]|nr:hypothetical protein MP228_007955 [Amoeboaphelidium protococcarum]
MSTGKQDNSSHGKSRNPYKNFIAGGIAGAVEATIMYPTEFVKTQLQLQQNQKTVSGVIYKGPVDCVKVIVKERGFLGLYQGVSTLIIGTFAKAAIRFAAFNHYSSMIQKMGVQSSTVNSIGSGLLAGVTESLLAVIPTETIKTKLINDRNTAEPKYRGLVHGVKTIVREEGFIGIYQGVMPTVMRQACNSAIRFTAFQWMQNFWKSQLPNGANGGKVSSAKAFASGAVAGTTSTILTMPIDVIKTRMQGIQSKQYKSMLDCGKQILLKEGVFTFWKGTTPRLSRVVFSSGIVFSVQDFIMRHL